MLKIVLILGLVIKIVFCDEFCHKTECDVNVHNNKVILDIDPGIDDVEALIILANAHLQGKIKILAIIITDGNTSQHNGLTNTFRILHTLNIIDIPVYIGAHYPIVPHTQNMRDGFFGQDGFADLHWHSAPPTCLIQKETAPEIIGNLVRQHPEAITYIAVGPLTNLALAMRIHAHVAQGLAHIYAMAGLMHADHAEFNVRYDPEAAEIVLGTFSGNTRLTLFTWEACSYNVPKRVWFENATITNPLFNMVLAAEQSQFFHHPESAFWTNCDAFVALVYLQRDIITAFESKRLQVVLHDVNSRGFVIDAPDDTFRKHAEIIYEIDYELIKKHFLQAFVEICQENICIE